MGTLRNPLQIIFLHGLGDSANTAERFLRLFSIRGCQVLAPDLNKIWQRCQSKVNSITDALAEEIVRSLGTISDQTRTLLISHSAGALVGLALAPKISTIDGLVLIEGSLRTGDVDAVSKYLDTDGFDSGRKRLISQLQAVSDQLARQYCDNVMKADPTLFSGLSSELVNDFQLAGSRLRQLQIPILFVAGGRSKGMSSHEIQKLASIPKVSVTIIESGGHWVHAEHPERIHSEITKWMNSM